MINRIEAIAEALVFAAGEPVSIEDIATVLKVGKDDARNVMRNLMRNFNDRKGGIILREIADHYQFSSSPDLHEDIHNYFEKPSKQGLSRAAMETLSIISYNQPVTKAAIEQIRGVNSDGVVAKLFEKGLINEVGRSDNPGRPLLYATTLEFLKSIGIETLKDLPSLDGAEGMIVEEMIAL